MDWSIQTEYQKEVFSAKCFPFTLHSDTLSSSYKVLPHWHNEIEILYFQSGECYAYCDQKKIHCKKGDILFCNSYCIHGMEQITLSCNYLCFFFDQKIIFSNLKSYIPTQTFIQVKNSLLGKFLNNIKDEYYAGKEGYNDIIQFEINSFYLYLHRIILENNPGSHLIAGQQSDVYNSVQYKFIITALTYINEHLTEHITLSQICAVCGFSTSRFSILFKQYTGKSLVDYINISRCKLAYTYYVNNGYTVLESAHASGFENFSYFSRKFKEIYGYPITKISR